MTEQFQFTCSACANSFMISEELRGKKVRCPRCMNVSTISAGTPNTVAAPGAKLSDERNVAGRVDHGSKRCHNCGRAVASPGGICAKCGPRQPGRGRRPAGERSRPMEVECPQCGAAGKIPDASNLKPLRCRRCGERFHPQPTTFVPSAPDTQQVEDFAALIDPEPIYDLKTRGGKPTTRIIIAIGVAGLLFTLLAIFLLGPLAKDDFKPNKQPVARQAARIPAQPVAPWTTPLVFVADALDTILAVVVNVGIVVVIVGIVVVIVGLSLLLCILPTLFGFRRGRHNQAAIAAGPPNGGTGLVAVGYVCGVLSLLILPPALGISGLVCGIINLVRGRTVHGIAQIIISVTFGLLGMIMGGEYVSLIAP